MSDKVESFFRILKVEEVCIGEYNTYEDVLFSIPHFIVEMYNKKDYILISFSVELLPK